MTQNSSYSGSMSYDKRDADDRPESNEIRADIDQTRQAVGEKIDQLQARLDPSRLKAQAQETVQEMISDTASSVTEYVRTHRDEMVGSLADAARRNPLPTALVGLGIGWLILESMAGGKPRDEGRWEYERRYLGPRGTRSRYEGGYESGYRPSSYQGGYGYSSEYGASDWNDEYVSYTPSGYPPSGYPIDSEARRRAEDDGKRHGNPLAKAAGAVKDTVGDVAGEIKDRVADASQEIKERVSDAGEEIKERMGGVRDRMDETRYRMENQMGGMRHQAERMGDRGQRTLQRAGYQMEEWQARARWEGQRRGQQIMRNLEDNPLTYGALALAAGAALAILLPQTRTENRVFGEARDQIMERGQEAFETAKERAQEVASEMRPELEEKARKLVSDVKEAGKEVVQEAKDELRPVMDKAVERTKEEARNASQELTGSKSSTGTITSGASTTGSTASQATGEKLVINRDTMRGQWNQIKGEVKRKWGQLTDDELTQIEGNYDKLLGVLQTRYGYTRGRAEQEINDFFKSHKA